MSSLSVKCKMVEFFLKSLSLIPVHGIHPYLPAVMAGNSLQPILCTLKAVKEI